MVRLRQACSQTFIKGSSWFLTVAEPTHYIRWDLQHTCSLSLIWAIIQHFKIGTKAMYKTSHLTVPYFNWRLINCNGQCFGMQYINTALLLPSMDINTIHVFRLFCTTYVTIHYLRILLICKRLYYIQAL